MARKTKMPVDSPAFWPLEADPSELEEYVATRVRGPSRETRRLMSSGPSRTGSAKHSKRRGRTLAEADSEAEAW